MQNVTQGQPLSAQYRGMQKPYEPVGFVQSFYGQNQQQQFQQAQQQPYQATGTAYRQQMGQIQQPQYGGVVQQPLNQAQFQQQQQAVSPQAFHTANYRGNQLGHDQYLRADSVQPTSYSMIQPQFQAQQAQQPYGQQIQQTPYQTQITAQQHIQPQLLSQQPQQAQTQYQPQQAQTAQFHTANYRGNQLGHDQYLRADSVQPAQQPQVQMAMNRPSYIS
jgi:hypothetical protein